jgi:hypothetical protein
VVSHLFGLETPNTGCSSMTIEDLALAFLALALNDPPSGEVVGSLVEVLESNHERTEVLGSFSATLIPENSSLLSIERLWPALFPTTDEHRAEVIDRSTAIVAVIEGEKTRKAKILPNRYGGIAIALLLAGITFSATLWRFSSVPVGPDSPHQHPSRR